MIMDIVQHITGEILHGRDGSVSLAGNTPESGFMVGGASFTVTVTPAKFSEDIVREFILSNAEKLSTPDYYVGWWTHNGRIYLDVSNKVESSYTAVHIGRVRKEIAVWDVAKGEEIQC